MILKKKPQRNNRSVKVSEIIRKAASEILIKNDLPVDPPFSFPINVLRVEMNSDLKIAYIYVSSYNHIDKKELIERLNTCKKYISKEVAKLISLKFSPKIIFRNDKNFESLQNLERIFNTEKVKKDLK